MRQYNSHSSQPVDFGTFSNNRYFNPYNELDILLIRPIAEINKHYSLEKWQSEVHVDEGSTRSPLHLNADTVTDILGDELVDNGTFTDNVDGWGGWPDNAEVTYDMEHLDNGALKANLPDASAYPRFFMQGPLAFPVENGQWYRMSFSLQSDIKGQLTAAVKGLSQMTGLDMIGARDYPFSDERREVEFIFQSTLTDQAVVQFTNGYQDPHYWLDNVSVKQVAVQAVDPNDRQMLLYNDQETAQTFPLEGCWSDVDGTFHSGGVTLPSFRSIVLIKETEGSCDGIPAGTPEDRSPDQGAAYPNPVRPGGVLHLPGSPAGTFRVWGVNGRLICESALDASSDMVTVPANLAPGAYVAAVDGDRATKRFKLLVQ
jgi:hypothetical protein